MGLTRSSRPMQAAAAPSAAEEQAWLEQARTLQRAVRAGRTQLLLRGKNLGLLCDDDTLPAAVFFRASASELGAHVAHIGMSLSERSPAQEVARTAHLLGRLYDAIECQGLAGALVGQLAELSGIPVYDGMALNAAQLTRLALLLGPESALADNRRVALQALLLHSIA
ncbi:MAG TPA: ornithine carbamoyltransferase [Rubrivivax sp.]|nr:ornithine carbamoyltransferase [Rubrivivax sp.]